MTSIVWTGNCSALEIFALNVVALKSASTCTMTISLHLHDDLSFGPAFFEIRQRLFRLIERKHIVDHRPNAPRLEQFTDLCELTAVWMHEQK